MRGFVPVIIPRDQSDAASHIQAWTTESLRYTDIPTFAIDQSSAMYKPPHPAGPDAANYFALKRNDRLAAMLPNQMLCTVRFFLEWLSISSANEIQSDEKMIEFNARYTMVWFT